MRADALLGETIRIAREPAAAALDPVARALGLGLAEAASGVLEVANAAMRRAIRLISVQRGFDLREFTLIAYGGAGPLHGGRLAQELGIPRVVVPAHAGLFSALGCAVTDVAYDHVQTFRCPLERLQAADLEARLAPLAAAVTAPLLAEGHAGPAIQLDRSVDVRYLGQNYELEVAWRGDLDGLRRDFQALHQRLYGYATGEAMECVNLRVRAAVPVAAARFPEWPVDRPRRRRGRAARLLRRDRRGGAARVPAGRPGARASAQGAGPRRGSLGHDPRLSGADRHPRPLRQPAHRDADVRA